MKKYGTYKDTSIEWIGEIPEHWELKSLRYISPDISAGGTPSTKIGEYWNQEDYTWLPSGRVQNKEIEISNEDKHISQAGLDNSSTKLIDSNTVLIALTGATCGNVGYLTFEACANQSVISIKNEKSFNSKYLFYYLLSQRTPIILRKSGGAQGGINTEDVKSLEFVSPSIEEQITISSYLDNKTSLIDKLIYNNKKLIKLLEEKRAALINIVITKGLDPNVKMKDSGIKWIGEIPEHWDRTKIKNLVKIRITDGPHETPSFYEEGIPFLSAESVQDGELRFDKKRGYISGEQYDIYKEKSEVAYGDILFCKSGSTTGKSAMVNTRKVFAIWSPLAIIRTNSEMSNSFMYGYMQSLVFRRQVINFWTFGTQPNIGMGNLENLWAPVPPVEEQKEIASYIDVNKDRISTLIKKIKNENTILKEYRQSLIANVVTGKIDVRNYINNVDTTND